ncbi:hypothetical protein ACIQTW_19625 [Paenarthrobacter sp. NPDC090517]|uniref:hypothetical protein n=1 Tax=Paenarthrobacter sp. NPDC090517 TaxID=3364381 RepID=UPI00382EF09C
MEVAEEEFFPDKTRQALAIAAVVNNGKAFETALHFLLNGFTFADPDEDRRAKTGMAGAQLKLLAKTVKRVSLRSVTRDRILAWVEDAQSATNRRNAVVHRPFFVDTAGRPGQLNRGTPEPLNDLSIESLNLTISALRKAVEEGGRLTWELRDEECWNGQFLGKPPQHDSPTPLSRESA